MFGEFGKRDLREGEKLAYSRHRDVLAAADFVQARDFSVTQFFSPAMNLSHNFKRAVPLANRRSRYLRRMLEGSQN